MADLVAIQMTSSPNPEENLAFIEQQLKALPQKQQLVVLPECFACFGGGDKAQYEIAEILDKGPIQSKLSAFAKAYNKWIVAGSMPIKPEQNCKIKGAEKKFYATSLVFDAQGKRVSRYDKIHLFDVTIDDNTGTYRESDSTLYGQDVVTFDSPWGRVGQLICYDLRFPELVQQMTQIDVLVVPSAFTQRTGQAHWYPLLQARSIENQCYVVASNQTGVHTNSRQTFGHSCIYSPWGKLLADLATEHGLIFADYESALLAKIRQEMPIQQHKKNRNAF